MAGALLVARRGEIEMFHTLRYVKKLEAAGVSRQQAEAHVQIIADIIDADFFTKRDARELELRLIVKTSAITGAMISLATTILALMIKS